MAELTTEEKNKDSIAKRLAFIGQLDQMWYALNVKCPYPGLDEIAKMVDMCTTVRANKFRFINTPRESDGTQGNVLFSRLKAHRAIVGGSKRRTINCIKTSWNVDASTYDKIDTFALLTSVCQGHITEEWARKLNIYATK